MKLTMRAIEGSARGAIFTSGERVPRAIKTGIASVMGHGFRITELRHHFHSADMKRDQTYLDPAWVHPLDRVFPWDVDTGALYRRRHSRAFITAENGAQSVRFLVVVSRE